MDNYAQGDTGSTGSEEEGTTKGGPRSGPLTCDQSYEDFKYSFRAKKDLIKREKEDFLFAMGDQWSNEDKETLRQAGISKPFVDNRIQPNLFLLTGLERQNRADFKAFPIGEEDSIKAEIASALFKDVIKKSGFGFKASDMFKDGIICGESHLELYMDFSESLINAKPVWNKVDGNMLFWDPESREYDLSDARWVYKLKTDIDEDDLVSMFPDKEEFIRGVTNGQVDTSLLLDGDSHHLQKRDYGTQGLVVNESDGKKMYDLLERYYKKWVRRHFVGDRQTGQINEAKDEKTAKDFISKYHKGIRQDAKDWQGVQERAKQQSAQNPGQPVQMPPAPPAKDPKRFVVISRIVPEIWYYAHIPGTDEPLSDEKACFFPNWKGYPFIPFFCRFSTAPLRGDHRHLLIQGLVHGVKGAQEKHNKAEMLMLRHLNGSTNSGWLSEEDAWVDPEKVKKFGTAAGVNLEYKSGKQPPTRISPAPLSQAHVQISLDSAESIKAQLGINSDLIAANESGGDSGRAISLRQKQGLLMVQELFDNLSRTRMIAGRFLLSQMNEIYDTELAKKVLGEGFLAKNFPPPMRMNPDTMQQEPVKDKTGAPMQYDEQMADLAIAEVLSGHLEDFEVTVGESVASETQRLANYAELSDFTKTYPGLIPPQVLIQNSQLPDATKKEVLEAIQQAQQAQAQAQAQAMPLKHPQAGAQPPAPGQK